MIILYFIEIIELFIDNGIILLELENNDITYSKNDDKINEKLYEKLDVHIIKEVWVKTEILIKKE